VAMTVPALFVSGDAAAFTNTIHPIPSPTVRDHRGANGSSEGGVTVTRTCNKANPCGGGYGAGHGGRSPPKTIVKPPPPLMGFGGGTVRDHRGPITCLGNLC
jgi:hypothetical protein